MTNSEGLIGLSPIVSTKNLLILTKVCRKWFFLLRGSKFSLLFFIREVLLRPIQFTSTLPLISLFLHFTAIGFKTSFVHRVCHKNLDGEGEITFQLHQQRHCLLFAFLLFLNSQAPPGCISSGWWLKPSKLKIQTQVKATVCVFNKHTDSSSMTNCIVSFWMCNHLYKCHNSTWADLWAGCHFDKQQSTTLLSCVTLILMLLQPIPSPTAQLTSSAE